MSESSSIADPRRWLKWAIVPLILLLVWFGLRPRPVEVDVGTVTRGPFEITVDDDGETRIRDPYLISAPLSGRLVRVELEPGDLVTTGQVIAVIDPGEPELLDERTQAITEARVHMAEAAVARARSQLAVNQAEAEKAQRYYERDRKRMENGEIAAPMLEDMEHLLRVARNNSEAAESALEMTQFDLEQAKAALQHSTNLLADGGGGGSSRQFEIRSPIDGVVLRRFQESSTVLQVAGEIIEIGDPDDLEIRIDVLSEDAVKIRPGNLVRIEHWGGPQPLEALVRRVEPSAFTKVSALGVDEQRVWVYADFSSEDPADETASPEVDAGRALLGDGYRIEARIVVDREESALKVPSGALFREPGKDGWSVYRVENGKAALAGIERGRDNGIEASVEGGLEEGDTVILHPGDRVDDGVKVEVR